jgi:hypothetical protein
METWFAKLRGRSLAARAAFLGLVVVGLYGVVSPAAGLWGGWAGLWAAAAAAGVCLAGALSALVASHVLSGPKYALAAMLAGTAARMGIPLAFALACQLHGGALAEAGLLYYLLIFYPVTLGIETVLSLPVAERSRRCSKPS